MIDIKTAIKIIRSKKFIIDNNTKCKLAIRSIQHNGYVKLMIKGRCIYLHRLVAFAYLGLDLNNENIKALHKRECPNRHCFSENHLYLGTQKDNCLDYIALGKHHEKNKLLCDNGHKFNRIIYRDGGRVRVCSICMRERKTKWRKKNK